MSSGKDEVEIKFRVDDPESLEKLLRKNGFRLKSPRAHEMNTLYDDPSRALTRRGELLRLREYGKSWKLTHKAKGKLGRHKSRVETETKIEDGYAMASVFESLGLEPIFRYEKFRAEWSDGDGEVVMDETPIGNFAEIEGPAKWIDATAKALGVRRADYITQNYASLFFAWKRTSGSPAEEMTFKAVGKRKGK